MTYRENEKAIKQRSARGVAERERLRIEREAMGAVMKKLFEITKGK